MKEAKMKYRPLGRTGIQVSVLGLGCMMFGGKTDDKEAESIINRAIEKGINLLDTANVYGYGRSEEVVGKALKTNGKRNEIILATKVHNPMNQNDPNAMGTSRRHVIEQCEASLNRLQTDYIDLYYIHRPRSDTPIDETLRALDDLTHAGKIRYVGTSTFAAWQLMESLWVAKELGLNRVVSEQPPFNLLDRRIERELLPMAQTYGIGIIVWSPLAYGLLTGKYTRNSDPPAESRLSEKHPKLRALINDRVLETIESLETLIKEKQCKLSHYAVAWCLQQSGIASVLIGPKDRDQFED